ncbi:MAG: 4-alpha-glucanotransferase [Verrucomicrobiota bacterium]
MNLSPDQKIAGVLAPLFALRSENDLGIGDLGALRECIDWSSEFGFKLVQLLPINEVGGDSSPYNAISAVAIEPTTLELAPGRPVDLTREDFENTIANFDLIKLRRGSVKYRIVKKLKRSLLEKAFAHFGRDASEERRSSFRRFSADESAWLDDYAFFRVLMEENGGSEAWDQWRPEHQTMEQARQWLRDLPSEEQSNVAVRQDFFRYMQWIAHEQWREIKAYAEERGIALMGDIPFGISYYSADVFARPNEFALDWSGGAPPEPYFKDDEFTQKWGQNWGIPLYRWETMRANNLRWWRQRIRGVKHVFHVFRIDHVLGFYRIYSFPWRPSRNQEFLPLDWHQMHERTEGREPHFAPRDDATPDNCEANRQEGEQYLKMVLEESGGTRVVGEDLGTVPDYVRPSLRSLGIAGFKIPQWEVRHERVIPGTEYETLSVATYATHDHKPIRALWDEVFVEQTPTSDQARFDLTKIADFAGLAPTSEKIDFEKDFYPAIMNALFASNAWIAVVMITDLLGRKYRFNVPGTAANSNWTRRMQRTVAQLRSSRKERARARLIRGLLEKTGRV